MYLLKSVIAATNVAQPIIPDTNGIMPNTNTSYQQVIFQNNGANSMHLGDSTVTATNGILLFQTGSLNAALALQYSGDLKEFFVIGTAGDVLNIMVFE